MLNVFITVDTEIWCDGWDDLDSKFPAQFKKYIYGPTREGNFALPGTLKILEDFGLPAVFFVEPLFSARFGLAPLQEIVGLIREKKQEVQLHIHPEWVNEVNDEILPGVTKKVPRLSMCSLEEQSALIKWGLARLALAGVTKINSFRAGSYAANVNTLTAVAQNGIMFDSSYNPAGACGVEDIAPGETLSQPSRIHGVYEYPVSVVGWKNRKQIRILQVTACSYREFVHCLNMASDLGWDSLVIVTHNFELLSPDKSRVDKTVLDRFVRLCKFLDDNKDRFNVRGFRDLAPTEVTPQPSILLGKTMDYYLRTIEQTKRRIIYR